MLSFIETGWWIPLVLLAVALVYGIWIIFQKLDRFRMQRNQFGEGLDDLLLPYRAILEKITRAEERLKAGEAQHAVELLTDLENKATTFPIIDYWLGKGFEHLGQRESAETHFNRFVENCRPYDALTGERIAEAKAFLQKNS